MWSVSNRVKVELKKSKQTKVDVKEDWTLRESHPYDPRPTQVLWNLLLLGGYPGQHSEPGRLAVLKNTRLAMFVVPKGKISKASTSAHP